MKTKRFGVIQLKSIVSFLFFVLVFNVLLLPNDTFNIKMMSLFLLLCISVVNIRIEYKYELLIFLCGLILPVITIMMSIIETGEIYGNISYGYVGTILLLYFSIKRYKVDLVRIFIICATILAIVEFLVFILNITNVVNLFSNPIALWFEKTNNALMGEGLEHTVFGSLFYIKSASVLLILEAYSISKKNYFLLIITCIGLFCTGTRANVFLMIFVLVIFFIKMIDNIQLKILSMFILLIGVMYVLFGTTVLNGIEEIFVRKSGDDSIRNGHLISLISYWRTHFPEFLMGAGYTGRFFSSGVNEYVSQIELSYLNILFQIGIFWSIPFYALLVYPFLKIKKMNESSYKIEQALIMGYFCYLLVCVVDPFLYNSTGIFVILLTYVGVCLRKGVVINESAISNCFNDGL